uniref:Uncharacterized protein n=1 Tax=Rhizophora mucronata TaxID=61149 RepID=A0A2P2QCT7_RHIMU
MVPLSSWNSVSFHSNSCLYILWNGIKDISNVRSNRF